MSNELETAARAASEATGLSVETQTESDEPLSPVGVDVYTAIDSEENGWPAATRQFEDYATALAYLEGLEAGARIANTRHAALVAAAIALGDVLPREGSSIWTWGMDEPRAAECSHYTAHIRKAIKELDTED